MINCSPTAIELFWNGLVLEWNVLEWNGSYYVTQSWPLRSRKELLGVSGQLSSLCTENKWLLSFSGHEQEA